MTNFFNLLNSKQYHNVCINFPHGLGDSITFTCNVLPVLQEHFPDINFFLNTRNGQPEIFGEKDNKVFDLTIDCIFPTAEWDASQETKAEKCLRCEFNITTKQQDIYKLPYTFGSPLVGCHFFCTSGTTITSNETFSKFIWDKIIEAGLIPFDTHFIHPNCKVVNHSYPFANRNLSDIKEPTVGKLIGLIKSCGGFIGVSGGNFWTALTQLPPQCICYIETIFPVQKLTRLPVHHIKSVNDTEELNNWLNDIKSYISKKDSLNEK